MNLKYRPLRVFALFFALCEFSCSVHGSTRTIRGGSDQDLDNNDKLRSGRSLQQRMMTTTNNNKNKNPGGATVPGPAPANAPAPAPRTNDIVDIMTRRGGFDRLLWMLYYANLATALKDPAQQFTIFAPANQAFPSAENLANLVVSKRLSDLQKTLNFHVVPGIIRSTDLFDGARLTTVQGDELVISLANGHKVNNANILVADIEAINGIIHSIDRLLMPF